MFLKGQEVPVKTTITAALSKWKKGEKKRKKKKKQTVTYLLYIWKRLKVLKINCINTDWSILFFFDLKNYISYCKDVYKYFNLSSVNFFVAGLNLFYFSMALWQRTLYYFNITQLWTELQTIWRVMLWTVFCWDGDFIGSEQRKKKTKENLLNLLHPAYFLFSDIKHILFYIITEMEMYKHMSKGTVEAF